MLSWILEHVNVIHKGINNRMVLNELKNDTKKGHHSNWQGSYEAVCSQSVVFSNSSQDVLCVYIFRLSTDNNTASLYIHRTNWLGFYTFCCALWIQHKIHPHFFIYAIVSHSIWLNTILVQALQIQGHIK